MVEVEIKATFELETSFHSRGDIVSLKVDSPISRDWKGDILIPATLIKGTLRHNIERILSSLEDINICNAPKAEQMCGICILCRSFGSPGNKARLFFSDCSIPFSQSSLDTRMATAINRKTKTVREKALFSTEVCDYYNEIEIPIKGFFGDEDEALLVCGLILLGYRLGLYLGGHRSRGLGWFRLKGFNVFMDGQGIPVERIKDIIKEKLR